MINGVVTIPLPGPPIGDDEPAPDDDRKPAVLEFIAGPENRLVEPAVLAILSQRLTPFNPLVLYGPSGTGKSHLARGIAATWKSNFPNNRVVCTTGVDFARERKDAFDAQAVEEFRSRYRGAALAVFEDLSELAADPRRSCSPAVQEELICTLDAIIQRGGQVLATLAAAPHEIGGLVPALQSRLAAGLCLPLALPGPDARRAILQRWSALREFEPGRLDPQAAGRRAGWDSAGASGAQCCNWRCRHDRKAAVLTPGGSASSFPVGTRPCGPSLRNIAALTARHFSLRLADLRGASRRRPVSCRAGRGHLCLPPTHQRKSGPDRRVLWRPRPYDRAPRMPQGGRANGCRPGDPAGDRPVAAEARRPKDVSRCCEGLCDGRTPSDEQP